MICPLYQQSIDDPEAIFLQTDSTEYCYVDLHCAAVFLENWLEDQDVLEDDIIAISQGSPFLIASLLFACARAGVLLSILSDREPDIVHEELAEKYNFRLIKASELAFIEKDHPWRIKKDPHSAPSVIDENIPFSMLFTSGSTASQKAVIHSFSNHWNSAKNSALNIPFQKGDRWLLSLSLWHVGGLALIFRAIAGGATLITRSPKGDLSGDLTEKKITHVSVVATQLAQLLPDAPFPTLKALLVGGGPIPYSLVERAVTKELPIHTTYGMTELSSQCTTTRTNASVDQLRSAGIPLGDWQIKISDRGEILVKGRSLFLGYWDGSIIHEPYDQDGFFPTKDTGYMRDNHLYTIGRIDQMFISGGENIHPEEIEKQLRKFVTQAIVVPIYCKTYGARPIAFLHGEYELEKIKTHLSQQLPKFKHPDHYLPWPPQISLIKPSRKLLQSLASSLFPKPSHKSTLRSTKQPPLP